MSCSISVDSVSFTLLPNCNMLESVGSQLVLIDLAVQCKPQMGESYPLFFIKQNTSIVLLLISLNIQYGLIHQMSLDVVMNRLNFYCLVCQIIGMYV